VLQRGAPDSEYELTELWQTLPEREHYSYIFEGNGQVLDHILASRALREEQQSDHDPPLARFRVTGGK
jgi:uncharacterized protein